MIRLKVKTPELVLPKPKNSKEALEQSIKKWNWMLDVIEEVDSMMDDKHCPLCNLFDGSQGHCTRDCGGDDSLCQSCPIDEYTNGYSCEDTPYDHVLDSITQLEARIQDELEFLDGLEGTED